MSNEQKLLVWMTVIILAFILSMGVIKIFQTNSDNFKEDHSWKVSLMDTCLKLGGDFEMKNNDYSCTVKYVKTNVNSK